MEKKQYDLCLEVLRRLSKAKILDNVIIIGSWCTLFYKEYFKDTTYSYSIKTRDIDFLVPFPTRFQEKVDVPGLLKDLGFIVGFEWPEGYLFKKCGLRPMVSSPRISLTYKLIYVNL